MIAWEPSGGEWIYSAMTDTQRVLFWAFVGLGYYVVKRLADRALPLLIVLLLVMVAVGRRGRAA